MQGMEEGTSRDSSSGGIQVTQQGQFTAITAQIINPSRKSRNPAFYHPCCRDFNRRPKKSRKVQPQIVIETCKHVESIRITGIFEKGDHPLTPDQAWDQFKTWITKKKIDHDFNQPFLTNQAFCLQKEKANKPTFDVLDMLAPYVRKQEPKKQENETSLLQSKLNMLKKKVKSLESENHELKKVKTQWENDKKLMFQQMRVQQEIMDGLNSQLLLLKTASQTASIDENTKKYDLIKGGVSVFGEGHTYLEQGCSDES